MGDKYKCSQYWCIDDYWIFQPLYSLNVQKCIWCKGVKTIFHVFMYFVRWLKTNLESWSNRLKPLEIMQIINNIPMTTLPLLFKPSNCYEKNNFIRSFYCLQYDNHYACVWFQTDKIILQLCLANVSFVVRILSQPRTSKMILMLTVYQSVINRMRSHPQQLICWWKSFNAVTWFYYLHFFCTYINVSFDKLSLIRRLDNRFVQSWRYQL